MKVRLLVCRAAFAICLVCGLAAGAMAVTAEGIAVSWLTGGPDYANALGNGGTNDGVINILGQDGINTLTITAVGAGPGTVIQSSGAVNGLMVGPSGAAWWENGNYMDVQFSLAGGATQLVFNGGVFNWFNTNGGPVPGGTGETLLIKNITQGTLLATIDYNSITMGIGGEDVLIDGLGLAIPLGDTIRLEAQNTTGPWPENTWITRLSNFSAVTIPEPATFGLLGLAGMALLGMRPRKG